MNMLNAANTLTFTQVWATMGAEVILVIAAFLLMIVDLILPREMKREGVSSVIAIVALLLAAWRVCIKFGVVDVLSGMSYLTDDFGTVFKLLFLATTTLVLIHSLDYNRRVSIPVPEYTYLLLFATVGAMVMASSLDLVTIYVGLELLSISSYILVGLRKRHAESNEAAMKYLVIGSIASALILYGMSFLYGLTGTTSILDASRVLYVLWDQYHALAIMSFLFMFAGFAVKISVVPFHQWAPDTYQGAPTPITSFLAVLSKAAGFAVLIRVFVYAYSSHFYEWYVYLAWVAVLTMIVGNVAAMLQRNAKRLLAYSSIAQAGYVLVPFVVLGHARVRETIAQGLSSIFFYLVAYMFMTVGTFAVMTIVSRSSGSEDLDAFSGLHKKSPWLALAMAIFLLSMAGMPLTAGFTGKFFIVLTAINTGFAWLAIVLFIASVISFYYYFGIVKKMYMEEPVAEAAQAQSIPINTVVGIGLVGTIALGIIPGILMKSLPLLTWFGAP